MELLPLLCLCLLTRSGVTSAQLNGPENIKVEGGADVVLPCSLSTKENIEFKLFDWRKVAQKDDGQKEVFMYDAGIHYNNGRDGQSEEFKGRVSHFPDELKHGNASIIITNTKISDSGNYTCHFPRLQPLQIFHIQLVVEPHDKVTVVEDSDVILPCSLSTKENIESKEFHWKKVAQKDPTNVLVYNGRIDNYLQHKDFIGRVFHFQDELKHGNASIIIRNTTISDSGVYTCYFPRLQPSQTFYIELVVGVSLEPSVTSLEVTKNWARLQCQVKGASPKPEVEWQDSDGKKLPASSNPGGPDDIILLTTVTKTGNYSCVVTQRELNHQTTSQIHVYIQGSPTGWIVGLVLLALVAVVAPVLAVLVYKRCNPLKHNKDEEYEDVQNPSKSHGDGAVPTSVPKVIKEEEGSDVTLPCFLITNEDIWSSGFIWCKTVDGQMQILINNGNLDVYGFSFPLIQKHQMSHIKLDVVGPEVIKVEEVSDVTLPCSLWPEEDITSKEFIWKKMSKNDESEMEVFLYDNGDLYSDERPGQSEQFKDRVSHSPDKLKQGNASITIRNMTMADSGEYMCIIQSVQKPKIFHIKLVVEPKVITVEEGSDVTLPCSLSTKNLLSTWFVWKKTDDGQMVCLYNKGDLYSGKGAGQSEQFKGRVSHFEDELKQGNASITIRNTTRADSGVYICIIQSIQKPEAFYIKLVVDQLEQGNASITIRNTRTDSGDYFPLIQKPQMSNINLDVGPANIKDDPVMVQMHPKEQSSCARGADEEYEDVQNPSKSHGSTPEPNALHPFMMEERL